MKRILMVLVAALMMAAMLVVMAAPAFAKPPPSRTGDPHVDHKKGAPFVDKKCCGNPHPPRNERHR